MVYSTDHAFSAYAELNDKYSRFTGRLLEQLETGKNNFISLSIGQTIRARAVEADNQTGEYRNYQQWPNQEGGFSEMFCLDSCIQLVEQKADNIEQVAKVSKSDSGQIKGTSNVDEEADSNSLSVMNSGVNDIKSELIRLEKLTPRKVKNSEIDLVYERCSERIVNLSPLKECSDFFFDGVVFFGFDQSNIDMDYRAFLINICERYRSGEVHYIIIEGYSSSDNNSSYSYNLGARRAISLRRFLMANGVDNEKIKTVSHGDKYLLSSQAGESADRLNRRATIKLIKN